MRSYQLIEGIKHKLSSPRICKQVACNGPFLVLVNINQLHSFRTGAKPYNHLLKIELFLVYSLCIVTIYEQKFRVYFLQVEMKNFYINNKILAVFIKTKCRMQKKCRKKIQTIVKSIIDYKLNLNCFLKFYNELKQLSKIFTSLLYQSDSVQLPVIPIQKQRMHPSGLLLLRWK